MLSTSAIQDWHSIILEMMAASSHAISPQLQPSIKLQRLHELEKIGCVLKENQHGTNAYRITEHGEKYLAALKSGDLINPEKWLEDAVICSLYLAYGDVREAMPYIVDALNGVHFNQWAWDNLDALHIRACLYLTDNGYAHAIADAFGNKACDISWIKPNTSLGKRDENGQVRQTINFQMSPLAEQAFDVIDSYIREHNLRTHRQSGYASKAMVGEYALILAASLLKGQ